MRQIVIIVILFLFASDGIVHAQTLGHYTATSITVGSNTVINPNNPPANTTYMQVLAPPNFYGVVTAKPATGVVSVVNAKPVGVYTIKVKAFSSSGSSISRTFVLTVGKPRCSVGAFNDTALINTGPNQINVAIGDFNRDGKQDFASAHEGGSNTISIRLGNGLGGFSGNTEVQVGSHPYNLAIGDFNRDGKQDLAVTCQGGNLVSICMGDGTGGFSSGASHGVGRTPIGIAIADFNEDGRQDFVTCNLNFHSSSVRFGNGLGSFTGNTEVSVDSFPYSIVAGDFNSDGHVDFATVSGTRSRIAIRLGDGAGHFSSGTPVPVGSYPYGIAAGDFNNDGNQDLVASNFVSNTLSVRFGDGAGHFSGNTEVPVGDGAYSVTAGNLNGDGNLDLASVNYFDNTVSIKLGDGLGHFSGNTLLSTGSYPITIAVGEFNNDRKPDIIVSNYNDHSVSIMLGITGTSPVASISSNSPVCLGQEIRLFSDGDSTYKWSGPHGFNSTIQNPVIASSTPNEAGIYSVTVTNSSNCSAVASTIVNVFPLPVVSLSIEPDTLCYGGSPQTLSGGIPANGSFSGTGVVSGNQFNTFQSGPGNFPLTYTYADSHGCVDSAFGSMRVLICSGITELNTNESYVYPNPVIDDFMLKLPITGKEFYITLISADGRILKKQNSRNESELFFSMENFPDGIYILKIS